MAENFDQVNSPPERTSKSVSEDSQRQSTCIIQNTSDPTKSIVLKSFQGDSQCAIVDIKNRYYCLNGTYNRKVNGYCTYKFEFDQEGCESLGFRNV